MTVKQVKEMLDEIGIEYRYHHFETDEAMPPPFICWLLPGSDNFSADGKVYHKITELNIELYTDFKDMDLEEKIENVLEEHGLFYEKTEAYIESENMYEVLYETSI